MFFLFFLDKISDALIDLCNTCPTGNEEQEDDDHDAETDE
jgi:hypothetical protein